MSDPIDTTHELPRWLVIGFSGHRHLKDHESRAVAAVGDIVAKLAARFPKLAGVCSAASGADTLFAEEMLKRDAPLSVVLPFACERFAEDFREEPAGAWDRSRAIIRKATQLDVVHQLDADVTLAVDVALSDGDRSRLARDRAEAAYRETSVRTVDRADVFLAVWDEKPSGGGTAEAVGYARQRGCPLIIYNPETGVTTEYLDDLREADFRGGTSPSDSRQVVRERFDFLDQVASSHGPEARRLIKRYVILHLIASAGAAFAIVFGELHAWSLAPAAFEVIALGPAAFMLIKYRGDHHKRWLTHRVEAEVCRSFLKTWDIRRKPTLVHQPRPAIPGLPRVFRDLRFLRRLDRSPIPELNAVRETYLKERVDHQIAHFEQKRLEAKSTYRQYVTLSKVMTWGSIIAALGVVVLLLLYLDVFRWGERFRVDRAIVHFFEFLGIVLPLGATAASFLMVSEESSRRVSRYGQMKAALEHLRPIVATAPTWDALARAATEVEEELLQELVEWQSFVKHTEHLH